MTRDEAFRAWCTRNGTAQEALAYDIWCAAWEESTSTASSPKISSPLLDGSVLIKEKMVGG